jgi:hypothetical protein
MKKFKHLLLTIVAFLSFFFIFHSVYAASLNLSGSLSSSSTVVGNTVTVSFRISSSNALGYINYSMSYDTSKLTLTSGTQNNALYSFSGSEKSTTVTFKFRAKSKGDAKVTLNINEALDFSGNELSGSKSVSRTINIKTQAEIEASYSKNNNLSKLTISKGTLSPQFNKNTTSYTVEVENEVTSVEVSGSKEDSRSYVDGFKKYKLEEGTNKINIKVTAQNGDTKTYTINITRKELTPIVIELKETKFNVVRKSNLIKKPNDNYKETTIKINNIDVPAFVNENTNTTLVGLKDDDGNISLYTYKDDNYELYKEYKFNALIITITDSKDIPKGYTKTTIKLGEDEIEAYKPEDDDNYFLFTAQNISTGKTNIYQYDKNEETIQIYHDNSTSKINELENTNKTYGFIIIGLGIFLIITYIVILISSINNKNKIKKYEKVLKEKLLHEKELEEKRHKEEEKIEENKEKDEKVVKEIEKKKKKDDKIEEDISSKSKKKKK